MTQWSEHVKKYAKKNKMSYQQANTNKKCKEEYQKKKRTSPNKKRMNMPGGGEIRVTDEEQETIRRNLGIVSDNFGDNPEVLNAFKDSLKSLGISVSDLPLQRKGDFSAFEAREDTVAGEGTASTTTEASPGTVARKKPAPSPDTVARKKLAPSPDTGARGGTVSATTGAESEDPIKTLTNNFLRKVEKLKNDGKLNEKQAKKFSEPVIRSHEAYNKFKKDNLAFQKRRGLKGSQLKESNNQISTQGKIVKNVILRLNGTLNILLERNK